MRLIRANCESRARLLHVAGDQVQSMRVVLSKVRLIMLTLTQQLEMNGLVYHLTGQHS